MARKIRDGNVGTMDVELGLMGVRNMSVLGSSTDCGEFEECVNLRGRVGFLSFSIPEAMSSFRNKCLVLSP